MNDQKDSNRLNKILAQRKDEPGFWREVWQQIRLVCRLIVDPHVPVYLKILPFLSLAYLFFPFDLIPDMLPIIGQMDDLAILIALSKIFVELSPQDVVQEHREQIRAVDGTSLPAEKDPVAEAIIIEGKTDSKS
jgi:uncharacterized membrane protein YkvA (DUF1232 family)